MTIGKRFIGMIGETPIPDLSRKTLEQWTGPSARKHAPALTSVIAVDLDLQERVLPPMTEEELAMFHERLELHHADQRARYWHTVAPDPSSAEARSLVTAELGLREFDIRWHSWPPREDRGGQQVGYHHAGVLAEHTPSGICVVSTDHRSQVRNREAARATLREIFARLGGSATKRPDPIRDECPYAVRKMYACNVCESVPTPSGEITHSKACYQVSEEGGGYSFVDLPPREEW